MSGRLTPPGGLVMGADQIDLRVTLLLGADRPALGGCPVTARS